LNLPIAVWVGRSWVLIKTVASLDGGISSTTHTVRLVPSLTEAGSVRLIEAVGPVERNLSINISCTSVKQHLFFLIIASWR